MHTPRLGNEFQSVGGVIKMKHMTMTNSANSALAALASSMVLLGLAALPTQAASWAAIKGNVRTGNGAPVCALVLANGQYMFSCGGSGGFSLDVPPDEKGLVTLFAFADGFAPFRVTAAPAKLPAVVQTKTADPDSPLIAMTRDIECAANNWVRLSGEIESEGSDPLCALVLANGQHMFSCGASQGRYDLDVPVDGNGQVTVFGFADGFSPFSNTFAVTQCRDPIPGNQRFTAALSLIHSQHYGGIFVTGGGQFSQVLNLPELNVERYEPASDACVLNVAEPVSEDTLANLSGTMETLDAGDAVRLRRDDESEWVFPLLEHKAQDNVFEYMESGYIDPGFYRGGNWYSFSGSGGADVGPFVTPSVIAPAPLGLATPEELPGPDGLPTFVHNASVPLPLVWEGNGGTGEIRVEIYNFRATPSNIIDVQCRFVDDGFAEIPPNFLTELRNDLLNETGPYARTSMQVRRENHQVFETEDGQVHVTIGSTASVDISWE